MKLPKKKDFKIEVFKYMLPILKRKRKKRRKETIKYIKEQEKYFLTTIYRYKSKYFRIMQIDAPIIGIKYMAMKYRLKSKIDDNFLVISIP